MPNCIQYNIVVAFTVLLQMRMNVTKVPAVRTVPTCWAHLNAPVTLAMNYRLMGDHAWVCVNTYIRIFDVFVLF